MPIFVPRALEPPRFLGNRLRVFGLLAIGWIAGTGAAMAGSVAAPLTITTYHGDTMRTGWNAAETILSPATVNSKSFGQLGAVPLDAQVDAQPLYVGGQQIAGGVHNVVYVATEANTIYAIDADTGAVLLKQNFGKAVPFGLLPGACNNNAATVGITSTPVIDTATRTLYVITYALEGATPVYRIHALGLSSLTDTIPSVVVQARRALVGGSVYSFNAAVSRQRAGLLEANGNIYAGFASFCDVAADLSRGWVLGWQAGTLKPLAGRELVDRQATSPDNFFLTPIWMSGFGLAADEQGSLFFTTGNSDPTGTSYDKSTNLSESVVKLSPDLTKVQSYFTPDAPRVDQASLDQADFDFGSGGVTVLPLQPGSHPRMAVAAGKVGVMYLLNRDSLGGFHDDGVDHVLDSVRIGFCYCGESYFQGSDGIGRVVSSGGSNVMVWRIKTAPRAQLVLESSSTDLSTGQEGGFLTSVSSNGTQANTQIIWAVSRPIDSKPAAVRLYAFDPSAFNVLGRNTTLFSAVAGNWPSVNNNATIVPLVANGRVFVTSFKRLAIFGLKGGPALATETVTLANDAEDAAAGPPGHAVYGRLEAVDKQVLTLRTRTGAVLRVDGAAAGDTHRAAVLVTGRAYVVRGDYDKSGALRATSILKAKDSPALWLPDN